jgi:hypothetical protein
MHSENRGEWVITTVKVFAVKHNKSEPEQGKVDLKKKVKDQGWCITAG